MCTPANSSRLNKPGRSPISNWREENIGSRKKLIDKMLKEKKLLSFTTKPSKKTAVFNFLILPTILKFPDDFNDQLVHQHDTDEMSVLPPRTDF